MKTKNLVLIALALIVCLTTVLPRLAEAIPAFARTHKLSCSTCHVPFPRLNAFGEEFAGNGFTIPEQEKDRDFISAGDDLLKLNKTFPIAARFDAYGVYESQTENDVDTDLQTPWGLKLLSGGNLSRNVGYYFYFFMDERGEVAGVEDAYIHFNNLGGSTFDIMIGQFQTSDPLMKRELRLTYEDYNIYKTKIGDSQTNLTYDRGVMLTYDIESTGTGLVGLVVNGNGKPDAGEDRKFDQDKYKNFAFRISQDIGDYFGVGYYIYSGEELGGVGYKNKILYNGVDCVLGNGMFDLTFQYLWRKDTNPTFLEASSDIKTEGMVAELIFSPHRDRSRHYWTLLYNQTGSDLDIYDDATLTGSMTYLLARNLRGVVEYTRNLEHDIDRGVLGFVAGF